MIPALYPEVDPLRLEAFLGTRDYELIKQFPNVYVLPFYGRGGDPAQKCFGAGLARLMIRNLMLLRNVSIHGPEDTPAEPCESAAGLLRSQPRSGYIIGVAGLADGRYSLDVELHRAGQPVRRARVDQPDFKAFVFECSSAISGLLDGKLTESIRQAWTVGQPRDAQSLVQLGQLLLGLPREKEAERAGAARQLLDADPDLSVAAWEIDGDAPGAQQDFLAALDRDPYNAQLCFTTFTTIWHSKGPQPEALQFCRRAIELSPGHGKAHMCAPHAAQRPAEMLNHSELGYRLLPGNPFAVNNYVLALNRANAPVSKRIELAQEGVAADPRDPGNYVRLIELFTSVNDPASALATAERLHRLFEPKMDARALYCLRQNPHRAALIDAGKLDPVAENRQRIADLKRRVAAAGPAQPLQSQSPTQVRCPCCHKYVEQSAYAQHMAAHSKLRPDGQRTDYVTLPEEEREQGSLAGVPKVYQHRKCGAFTGMPEDIIRSYLKDPYLYSGDRTFCSGCHTHVPHAECVWRATGENLQAYMDKLRAAKPRHRAAPLPSPPPLAQPACTCGTRVPVDASFCRQCGRRVRPPLAVGVARRPRPANVRALWIAGGALAAMLLVAAVAIVSTRAQAGRASAAPIGDATAAQPRGAQAFPDQPNRPRTPARFTRATVETLGLQKSKMVGLTTGGGPYELFSKSRSPVVGFRFGLGPWSGGIVVRHLDPIYRDDNLIATNDTVLARDGYVVSGVRVNGHISAIQPIFTREQDGHLVPGDTYDGPWLGQPTAPDTNVLDGDGQPVMGIYGRRGMNVDAIGVLYAGS
jgi:hypothetical protein